MKKLFTKATIFALFEIAAGALCIILQSNVIKFTVLVIGFGLIACGLVNLLLTKVEKEVIKAVAMMVIGIILVISAFAVPEIIAYLLAFVFIFYGATNLIMLIKKNIKLGLIYIRPLLQLLIGVLLIVEQAFTLDVLVIIIGVVLIIEGLFEFITLTKHIK